MDSSDEVTSGPVPMDDGDAEQVSAEQEDMSSTGGQALSRGAVVAMGVSAKSALPSARIKTIMKSAPESMATGADAVFLVSRATEYFIASLTQKAHEAAGNSECIEYRDLSDAVNTQSSLRFLNDVVPKKVRVRDYLSSLQPPR